MDIWLPIDDKKAFKSSTSLLKSDLVKKKRSANDNTPIESEQKRKKNRPQELPSNKPVARLRENSISGITIKKNGFDPRFEGPVSEREQKTFESAYRFIDNIKEAEINVSLKKFFHDEERYRSHNEILSIFFTLLYWS